MLPAIAFLALVSARDAGAAAAAKTIRAHFACTDGKAIDATFINGTRSSVRLKLSDGRELSLPQALSASGARYANKDESVVFWNKGDTAFVEEAGKTTYADCVASKSNDKLDEESEPRAHGPGTVTPSASPAGAEPR